MDHTYYIGIDISCKTFDAALYIDNTHYQHSIFDNTAKGFEALLSWLDKAPSDLHLLMEATNVYWEPLAYYLDAKGATVSVLNPKCIKGYASSLNIRSKTDIVDAKLIARYCAKEQPQAWLPPKETDRALLLKLSQLEHLKGQHQSEQVRKTMLRDCDAIASCQRTLDFLATEIVLIQAAIDELIKSDETLKRNAKLLASIPAVGKLTVPWLLAYLGDGKKFKKSKQATSFAGLTPMIHQSGTSVEKKPRISKIGHSEIRKVLYMPAMGFAYGKYKNGAYQSFVNRLNHHGKPKMVVIVALMRKILSIAQAVLKNQLPFDASLHAS